MRTTANQRGCDRKESIVPLQFEQARELANDNILRPDAEFRSQSRVIIRTEKWFEIEAAENFSVLLLTSNSSSQVLLLHRLGDNDKMGCDLSGESFRQAESSVAHPSLERAKGRPMNSMNDYRHPGTSGSQTSQHAGLAAMGMDDVRAVGAEDGRQPLQGQEVFPGMNGANQFRKGPKRSCFPVRRPRSVV